MIYDYEIKSCNTDEESNLWAYDFSLKVFFLFLTICVRILRTFWEKYLNTLGIYPNLKVVQKKFTGIFQNPSSKELYS